MDRREAIQIVEDAFSAYESEFRRIGENEKWDNIYKARDLAIEALQEPTRDELGDCHHCRFTGSTMCADCINGSRVGVWSWHTFIFCNKTPSKEL